MRSQRASPQYSSSDIPPRAREIITPSAYDHEERVLRRTLTQLAREKEREFGAESRERALLLWMKRQPALALTFLLLVTLVPLAVFLTSRVERANNASLRAELLSARAEVENRKKQVVSLQQELSVSRQELTAAQTQTGRLEQELRSTETRYKLAAAKLKVVEEQNTALAAQANSLRSSIEGFQALRPSLDLRATVGPDQFANAAENLAVREAINRAFELKNQRVRFAWNGRDPNSGLDSYGFVNQVLISSGVTLATQAPDLATAKLLFRKADRPQLGDILVFSGDYAMLYLGQSRAIGMTPFGIAIQKVQLAPRPLWILRVPYPAGN